MKSNNVSNVFAAMPASITQETAPAAQIGQGFDTILSGQTEGNSVMDVFAENDSLGEVQQTYEKERRETSYKEIPKAEDSSAKQVSAVEDNKEELEEKVTELLSEELEVSEEELKEMMETMGITLDSLINGTGLKDLMMGLTGIEDAAELLVNDTFGKLMKELEILIQDFSNQLNMTPEDLKASLMQLEISADEISESLTEDMVAVGEETVETDMSQQTEEQQAVEGISGELSSEDNSAQVLSQEDTAEMSSQDNAQTESDLVNNAGQDDSAVSQQVTYREVQTTVNAVGEQVTQVVEQNFIDAENIMHQITEITKVTVQQGQSSIEMQLNPEHLGKIYLQVAEKNGVITAQLAAENEAVKQTLENQLVTLKENMNQQGLKVEAVEVTIATHEFEQNLEGNQQSAQENGQQENGKGHRFLSVDNLDELSGQMSQEEQIAAQIMLDNGNSMDVTA